MSQDSFERLSAALIAAGELATTMSVLWQGASPEIRKGGGSCSWRHRFEFVWDGPPWNAKSPRYQLKQIGAHHSPRLPAVGSFDNG